MQCPMYLARSRPHVIDDAGDNDALAYLDSDEGPDVVTIYVGHDRESHLPTVKVMMR